MSSKKGRNAGRGSKKATSRRMNSPLAAHKQQGKILLSPFNTLGNLSLHSWLRDSFPDYLWVCFQFAQDLGRGTVLVVAVLDRVNGCLDRSLGTSASERPPLDGSLTSWERIPQETRPAVLAELQAGGLYDLAVPEAFMHLFGMYPGAPGSWLLGPWVDTDVGVEPAKAEAALNETILAAFHGQNPVATRAKAIAFRGLIEADKMRFGAGFDVLEMLPRYPDHVTEEERGVIEPFIRASFGTTRVAAISGEADASAEWAARFWRASWRIYSCRLADTDAAAPNEEEVRAAMDELSEAVDVAWSRFEETALKSDPDLFEPDRHEVLTGITARCLRILTVGVETPASWTTEHSAALLRSMAEALITISWLTAREDGVMFKRFKDFGRGRLKLLKLHLEEHADGLDVVPLDISEQLDRLEALVNEDLSEEFQDIDLSGTFSGVDLRKMAFEVGLESEYRLVLAPSSSDFHGEWGHMARYALAPCMNPAHRLHRIPRRDLQPDLSPAVIRRAVDLARRVVDVYVVALAG